MTRDAMCMKQYRERRESLVVPVYTAETVYKNPEKFSRLQEDFWITGGKVAPGKDVTRMPFVLLDGDKDPGDEMEDRLSSMPDIPNHHPEKDQWDATDDMDYPEDIYPDWEDDGLTDEEIAEIIDREWGKRHKQ